MDEVTTYQSTNNSAMSNASFPPEESYKSLWDVHITYSVLRTFQGALTMLGNGFVLLAVYKFQKLRTPANMLIVSLSLAGMLSGLTGFTCWSLILPNLSSHAWYNICIFHILFAVPGITDSILSIFLIAVERFAAVQFPTSYANH